MIDTNIETKLVDDSYEISIRLSGEGLTYKQAKKIFKEKYVYDTNKGYGFNPDLNRYSIYITMSKHDMVSFKRHLLLNDIL